MASAPYNRGMLNMNAALWTSGVVRVLLVSDAYAFDPDHNTVADVVANEIGVGGYARQVLANPTAVEDDANDRIDFEGDDTPFGALAAGVTIGGAILFDNTGGADAARNLIAFVDVVPNVPTNGGTITAVYATPIYRRT